MSSPNVLISGGGIAGSVFAFWLLKAFPRAKITMVERASALRLTGASVDLRSSAIEIVKKMGVLEEVRANGTNEKGIAWVNSKGRNQAVMRSSGREDVQSITSEYEIFRGKLASIFFAPIRERINLILDDYVDKYEQQDDGVTVSFAKSKEVKKYDYLIAADGFRSKIRAQMLGTDIDAAIHDEGVHVCYFTIKKDLLRGSHLAQWYNATKGRVVLVRPDNDPSGRTRGHFMCVTTKKDVETRKKLNDAVLKGNEAYMDLMEETFKDAGWISKEVLEGMRNSDDFYCSLFAQVRAPQLQDRRVVLLGDAGYATPGIGTSLAIIGAYTLAGELAREPNNIGLAFQRYEGVMKPFVKGHQGDDNAMQIMNPQSEWAIKLRNMFFGVITGLKIDQAAMRGMAWLGISEKKVIFPDYPWAEPVAVKA